jgi:hypothetical protein
VFALANSSSPPEGLTPLDPELNEIFGPPPVIFGEDEADYQELWRLMRSYIRPHGVIEEGFVRDLVDIRWEIRRFRQFAAGLLKLDAIIALKTAIAWAKDGRINTGALVDKCAAGDEEARIMVDELLKQKGQSHQAIEVRAIAGQLGTLAGIDQVVARLEARQHAVLREVDRHREALGRRARQAIADVTDIEPVPTAPGEVASG